MAVKTYSARLAIVGITGRMGTELTGLAAEFGFKVTGGVARSKKNIQTSAGSLQTVNSVKDLNPTDVDIVIDFALPESAGATVEWCEKNRKPLVSGVTGISSSQKSRYQEAAKTVAVLWSPNMSLGIAVVTQMLAQLKGLEDFDFQIEELHHKRKKDAPSGTALLLQEHLEKAVGSQPAPISIRGGGIFGIHKIWAMSEDETITIEHTAMNRRVFARGALTAAKFLLQKPPALYRIADILSVTAGGEQGRDAVSPSE